MIMEKNRMKRGKRNVIMASLAVLLIAFGGYLLQGDGKKTAKNVLLAGKEIIVYKTPTCGCCNVFVNYLKKTDLAVKMENLNSLTEIKNQYGVPLELSSCHTSIVDGYVVEGHIPLKAIEKLLKERPNIKGIALPGMPSGTPGMPGPKTEKWEIQSFTEDGTIDTFMTI